MSGLKVVSRKELFEAPTETGRDTDPSDLPSIEFEFIEVKDTLDGSLINTTKSDINTAANEEYDFPLFSFGVLNTTVPKETGNSSSTGEDTTETNSNLMKVSLREDTFEPITITRPRSYYFADYTEKEREQFAEAAVTADNILRDSDLRPYTGWPQYRGKVIDAVEHNKRITLQELRLQKLKGRRPSKRQRVARTLGKRRELERQKQEMEIKRMIKKKFHKRGGKKNKKKSVNPLESAATTVNPKSTVKRVMT